MNDAPSLAQIKGTIVLAGAGKMGGAMLSGWLAQGLDARSLGVIEPHPSDEIRALAAQGIRLNLSPREIGAAATLVVALKPQMFREAGAMLKSFAGPATLRQNVTSPGGTTAAALEVLMGPDGMQPLLIRAVAAATRRSRELAK